MRPKWDGLSERVGEWQQTYLGRAIYAQDPRPDEIEIEDIAHALAHQCRFAGHVRAFYSVAEHCVRASYQAPPGLEKAALFHDAPEAYIGDLVRPLKATEFGKAYLVVEAKLAKAIGEKFGVVIDPLPAEIEEVDRRMLVTEKRDLLAPPPKEWTYAQGHNAKPYAVVIEPWGPIEAKMRFLTRYRELFTWPVSA